MTRTSNERAIEIIAITWQGIAIEIEYDADWLGSSEGPYHQSHLAIRSVDPANAPLPITETGYRSHFIHPGRLAEHGGPEAYVRKWLDLEADTKAWKRYVEKSRQLSLF